MSGAGRGVSPGAEPEAGSGDDAAPQASDQDPQAGPAPQAGPGESAAGEGEPGAGEPGDDAPGAADKGAGAGEAADTSAEETGPQASPESGTGAGARAGAGTGSRSSRHRAAARKRSRGARFLREFVILVVIALVIAVAIKTYAIQAFFIPSGSMENTLEINDRVLVNKLVYDVRGIHRGDIVVFNGEGSWDPGSVPGSQNFAEKFVSGFAGMFGFGNSADILIKRVIGLPGDHVACCDAQGRVTVNGVPLNEGSYLYPGDAPSQTRFNIVVPAGRLWVMGDNRSISDDSRDHMGDPGGGTIPESAVIGRAFVIIWPPSQWRILPIPATFEQPKLNATAAASTSPATQDTATQDTATQDTATQDTATQDTATQDTATQDTATQDTATQDTATQDTATQDTATQDTATQDTATQDTATQDTATQDTATQDTATQDTATQDTATQDTATQDTATQDTATQDTAGLLSARLQPSSPALPLSLGFAAALPLSWLQRRARRAIKRKRS